MDSKVRYGKPVPDYPNYYVDEGGQIFNIETGKYLKGYMRKNGDFSVKLSKVVEGKRVFSECKVHKLVAILYIPNPENRPHIVHIDGDPYNNRADNLQWSIYPTPSDIEQYGKEIPEYPGYYVDEMGKVFSTYKNDYLEPIYREGVCPLVNIRGSRLPISQLVARVYIPNPTGAKYVMHIDGNKCNNAVNNLMWKSTLDKSSINEIYQLFDEGVLQKDIAIKYNVSQSLISNLKKKYKLDKEVN